MQEFINYTQFVSRNYQDASRSVDRLNRKLNDEFNQIKALAYQKVLQGERPKTVNQKQQTYSSYKIRSTRTSFSPKRKCKTSRVPIENRESTVTTRHIWVTSPSSQTKELMNSSHHFLTDIQKQRQNEIRTTKSPLSVRNRTMAATYENAKE